MASRKFQNPKSRYGGRDSPESIYAKVSSLTQDLEAAFEEMVQSAASYLPPAARERLRHAFEFSKRAHSEQLRAGGDPFITHPLAVAKILSGLHMDLVTLEAGLLHDVIEDTAVNRDELKIEFGEEVAGIVEGVTKIDQMEQRLTEYKVDASARVITEQAENWRKMLIATAKDVRVILLKLADRRHNMETLGDLPEAKQRRISEETLNLYVPLAQRLGMYDLKSDLADLSLKYLKPQVYNELLSKIAASHAQREEHLKASAEKIETVLKPLNLPFRLSARPKSIHSVYKKMIRQNKPFKEIQDLSGVRILTDTVEHCYTVLSAVHSAFKPLADSFTDYIAIPKNNLYQSLHSTVEIVEGDIVEVQIRTEEMNGIAEYGVAAHWRYKLGGSTSTEGKKDTVEAKMDWLKQTLEWLEDSHDPKEVLDGLKTDLEFDQVFVSTPKGEVKKLPAGSTPVDFAYDVHTELGNSCVGAKINDKMVRLDYLLKSGDRCEIQTRKGQHPHKDWLNFVKTPRARSKIRKYFRENL